MRRSHQNTRQPAGDQPSPTVQSRKETIVSPKKPETHKKTQKHTKKIHKKMCREGGGGTPKAPLMCREGGGYSESPPLLPTPHAPAPLSPPLPPTTNPHETQNLTSIHGHTKNFTSTRSAELQSKITPGRARGRWQKKTRGIHMHNTHTKKTQQF